MGYIYLLIATMFNILSSTSLKTASLYTQPSRKHVLFLIFGFVLGAVHVIFYSRSLEKINLSVAYITLQGISIVLLMIISGLLFRESISITKIVGAAITCLGIFIISK